MRAPRRILGWTAGVAGVLIGLLLLVIMTIGLLATWFPDLFPKPFYIDYKLIA